MNDATLSFSREMAKKYGITAALIYQELKRKQFYWESQGKLVDGFFWCDQSAIAEWVLVHSNTVVKVVKTLEEAGLIEKKISYRPGTTTPTTWWRVISEINPNVISSNQPKCDFYIKATTIATTEKKSQVGTSTGTDTERIKPAQLYSRVHSFFGGRHDRRKAMVEAIEKLQDELSDETILLGCQEISAHPTFKTKDGNEVTWTLSMLLLRDADGLNKTADIILKAADRKEARDKKEEKKKAVQYSMEECY